MKRIMIIDDEECIRETLGTFCEMLGYEPVLTEDPSVCNALHPDKVQCDTNAPCADILLVDQSLPTTTGLQFIERQITKGCRIATHRKALMSGAVTEEEFIRASRLGCHVLQKPVTYKVLENWLSGLEGRSS